MKTKSLYAAALYSELHHNDSMDRFCKLFDNISDAFAWTQKEHTDEEIAEILSKLGYKIEVKKTMDRTVKPKETNVSKKVSKTTQRLMTPKEAAAYLGTTISSLCNWRHLGRHDLPFVRWGRCVRYCREDLDAWIQSHVVAKQD